MNFDKTIKSFIRRINGSNRVLFELNLYKEKMLELQQHVLDQEEKILGLHRQALWINERYLNFQRKKILDSQLRITLKTNKKIAIDSNDHLYPRGTKQDNFVNSNFNSKLLYWISPSELSLLDLGCSGGGMVRSFIEDGILAIGVEGSDYSLKKRRAEWSTIPEFLFTADMTEPFEIVSQQGPMKFSVITLWEVIEHITFIFVDFSSRIKLLVKIFKDKRVRENETLVHYFFRSH